MSAVHALPAAPAPLPIELVEDARYEIVGELGAGGMGCVYDAIDRRSGERVAIKVLQAPSGASLLRFKNEFRVTAGLRHPNLVALYDLTVRAGVAWFAMEHVDGEELRRWVRAGGVERVHAAVAQVLDALEALGERGLVHRDLAPRNLLVDGDGRLRLIDFGLAGGADTPDLDGATRAGTPAYASPEQIAGGAVGPASDLYSLGAILYELLAGAPPFAGFGALRAHAALPPPPLPPEAPPSLAHFCMRLLAKRPDDRYVDAAAARRALVAADGEFAAAVRSTPARALTPPPTDPPLVGREREQTALATALDGAAAGKAALVAVTGDTGLGKSRLLAAAVAEATARGFVVLHAACREREAVPYNAFDAVVDDAVARCQSAHAELRAAAADISSLAALFPVVAGLVSNATERIDLRRSHPGREEPFAAAARLIARVTATQPVLVCIDDLQWADDDSLALLERLRAPGLLIIVATTGRPPRAADATLPLAQLDDDDAAVLWRALTDDARPRPVDAGGDPRLLVELARLPSWVRRPSVHDLVHARLAGLDADERRCLLRFAIAPAPLAVSPVAVERLLSMHLVREIRHRRRHAYEIAHHAIRRAVLRAFGDDEASRMRLELAATLEADGSDPAALVQLLVEAGDARRAARWAAPVAERAMSRLAYARALAMFELALVAHPDDAALLGRAGQAAEALGRYAAAAVHYSAALHAPNPPSAAARVLVELRLANCRLHAGDLEGAQTLVDGSLGALGIGCGATLLSIIWLFVLLALRTLAAWFFRPRLRDHDDTRTQARLLACALAIACRQLAGRNLEQLELVLRLQLIGARSPSLETRQEASALLVCVLLPLAHFAPIRRRLPAHFAALAATGAVTPRGRTWLPLLAALRHVIAGRPRRALRYFDALAAVPAATAGYVALQRRNALLLAGDYDRYAADVGAEPRGPVERARLAYIAVLRGESPRLDELLHTNAARLPWAERTLFAYQLVEILLLVGRVDLAAARAAELVPRIRRGAVSPLTGAFESLDAVVRAFAASAIAARWRGEPERARRLVAAAAGALRHAPLIRPPLFAARHIHDAAIVALARGRRRRGIALLVEAEAASRRLQVPCFRLRLIGDLLALLPTGDARRRALVDERDALERAAAIAPRRDVAPWISVGLQPR